MDPIPKPAPRRKQSVVMEDEESVDQTTFVTGVSAHDSMEVEDEEKQSEKLVDNLKKRRRRTQKELSKTLRAKEDEDVQGQMRSAKSVTRQRFLDETTRSATEGDDTAASAEPEDSITIPKLDLSEQDETTAAPPTDSRDSASPAGSARGERTTSPPTTAHTPRTAREDSQTPRRVSVNVQSSIRAKLTQKLREAKDKGKDEAYSETKRASRLLKDKRGLPRSTRFDDSAMIQEEEIDQEERLEKSLAMRGTWSKVVDAATGKKTEGPSEEDAFDFFTRQWEEEAEEKDGAETAGSQAGGSQAGGSRADVAGASGQGEGAEAETAPKDGEETEEEDEGGRKKKRKKKKKDKSEDETPLVEEEEDVYDIISKELIEIGKAPYIPSHDRMEAEAKCYFLPSVRPAPMSEKISGNQELRFLEEEGFYVGQRPQMPPQNINKMENRLIKEGDKSKGWFGEDGKLIVLPDPLKEIPCRPPFVEEVDPMIETEYIKATMSEESNRYINSGPDARGRFQLDVDVNTIVFTHHHLFSREHAKTSRLSELYQQYLSRNRKKAVDFLSEKLKALRSACIHVQQNIDNMKANKKISKQALDEQEKRLHDYKDEIKQTRQQRDLEMAADRNLSKRIIQTWKDIKNLRLTQKYSNTATKLAIRKEPANKAQDEAELEQDVEEELQELQEEADREYNITMEQYRQQLDAWKTQKADKKEASKRQKKRERRQERGGERSQEDQAEDDVDQAMKDRDILEAEELTKPEKPKAVSASETRQRIVDKFNQIRRAPGEPRLYFELNNSGVTSPKEQCPRDEVMRRNDIARVKIFVKVLFNNKQVSQTSSRSLGQDFVVKFAQIFNIEIMQWPESIKMEIYESVGMSSTLMSVIYAAIPEPNTTVENVHLEEIDFSSDVIKDHPHAGVGCGLWPDQMGNTDTILMTSGSLSASVAWAINEQGDVLIPPSGNQASPVYSAMKGMDAVAAIGVSGMSDPDTLTKWIAQSHLDPNDPVNSELMCLMRPSGDGDPLLSGMRIPEHFRLEQLQEEFNFTTDDMIDESRRFRMIQLREQEVTAFRNKPVPIFDKEIPDDTFAEYEKKKRADDKLRDMDIGESHRVSVAKFMQRVREQVLIRFRHLEHEKTLEQVVFEDAVPKIDAIIPSLVKLVEPRRPLRPTRKKRKKVTAQNLQAGDVRILVNVVRSFGIPVRAVETGDQHQGKTGEAKPKSKSLSGVVRPYVEVMFQRETEATSVAEGPNPTWNEELGLPFKPPNNDFSHSNLQAMRDIIYFNIFDEYIVDVKQDDRDRGTSIHRRIEKRWLGSFQIPFSTVYFNTQIEGTFRVDKPPVLLGYTHESKRQRLDGEVETGIGESNSTYISMFLALDPPIYPADPIREKFDSNEDEKLLTVADNWLFELEKKFPKREYKATVVDINGKSVFITRYLRAIKPPDIMEADDANSKAERLARYVSMIPFVSDSVLFAGICDIWSTCDQFLQMLQGDEEEHSVLLVNYFMHIGKTAYLVLGSAIPEGPTAYVLTKENNDYWLWNASTGEHFSYRDNYCPVQSIGCLVSDNNIWANIQPQDHPSRILYEVNNPKQWKPFFSKNFPFPGIQSIQPSELLYFPTDKSYVQDLSEKIERHLKEKIMEWRPQYITSWNRYCIHSFRRLLPKMEENHGKLNIQQEHSQLMDEALGSYKINGFPINLPYTDMDPITDAVFATGVHNYESSEVEFALAVHIHPYPNSVLSVWVYVANLVRKR